MKRVALFYIFANLLISGLNRGQLDSISASAFSQLGYLLAWSFLKIPLYTCNESKKADDILVSYENSFEYGSLFENTWYAYTHTHTHTLDMHTHERTHTHTHPPWKCSWLINCEIATKWQQRSTKCTIGRRFWYLAALASLVRATGPPDTSLPVFRVSSSPLLSLFFYFSVVELTSGQGDLVVGSSSRSVISYLHNLGKIWPSWTSVSSSVKWPHWVALPYLPSRASVRL